MSDKQVQNQKQSQSKNKKRKSSVILRLLVLGVAAYFVVTSVSEVARLMSAKAELDALIDKKQSLQLDIEQISQLLSSDNHKDIIEKAARERLGFVYSDEEVFVDTSGN